MSTSIQRLHPGNPSIDTFSTLLRGLVERNYLAKLADLSWGVEVPDWQDPAVSVRLARINEVSEMASSLSAAPLLTGLGANGVSTFLVVSGTKAGASVFIGSSPNRSSALSSADAFALLNASIPVHLPGIHMDQFLDDESFKETITGSFDRYEHIACLTGVPGGGSENNSGLETLINGLRGEQYMLIVLGEPVSAEEQEELLRNCRSLSSDIHMRVRQTANKSQQRSNSSTTQSSQSYAGLDMLISGLLTGFSPLNFLAGAGASSTLTQGESQTSMEGMSEGINIERLDKELAYVEEFLDEFVSRIESGRRLGLWNTGVYLMARSHPILTLGLSLLQGAISGGTARAEPLRPILLDGCRDEIRASVGLFQIPAIAWADGTQHPLGTQMDRLSTLMTSDELATLFNLPRRQVVGMRLIPTTQFNLNPPEMTDGITLGKVLHFGQVTQVDARISIDDLTRHTFVTGVTGAGKTNTCLLLIKAVADRNIPFLVIEPAKREYRQLTVSGQLNCNVYTLGDEAENPLRLNPFQFVPGFPVLTHIDYLKAIFNASFPMYASMPYILEEAILGVYEDWGWDVTTGKNRFMDGPAAMQLLPTLSDLFNRIDVVVAEKRYAERLTMDITAALKARIKSLMIGSKGKMLDTRASDSFDNLFTKPTILELRRIGSDDEKCFLIALLLVWLYEFCETRPASNGLQHLTLIEEAHRILQNLPPASSEMIGARSQAVNTFSNMLAEIRAYGEGLVIVDQIPAKLSPDVIKNTDLKILHRLVAADDRNFVGQAMTLTSEQNDQVARLQTGDAVVYYEHARTPLLVRFAPASGQTNNRDGNFPAKMVAPARAKRGPACEYCRSICRYGDQIEPTPGLLEAARQAVIDLLVVPLDALKRDWTALVGQAYADSKEHEVPRNELSAWLYCDLSGAFSRVMEELFTFYSSPEIPQRSRVLCELETMATIRILIDAHEEDVSSNFQQLARRLQGEVALQPTRSAPGCSLCNHRCRYGFWVDREQQKIQEFRNKLIELLKNTNQAEVVGVTRKAVLGLSGGCTLTYPDGFVHCVLTRLNLSRERLEALQFHLDLLAE